MYCLIIKEKHNRSTVSSFDRRGMSLVLVSFVAVSVAALYATGIGPKAGTFLIERIIARNGRGSNLTTGEEAVENRTQRTFRPDALNTTWTPQSRFWKHINESQSGLYTNRSVPDSDVELDVDVYDEMRQCIEEEEVLLLQTFPPVKSKGETFDPQVAGELQDEQNVTLMVVYENALTHAESITIRAVAKCTERFFPSYFQLRTFPGKTSGNDCTYTTPVLQLFAPNIAQRVQHMAQLAYYSAEWHRLRVKDSGNHTSGDYAPSVADLEQKPFYPPPEKCGLRTSEFIRYSHFDRLPMHRDVGSYYTILFVISDPDSYDGGKFLMRDSLDEKVYSTKPKQYSAIVFLSETFHGVSPINTDNSSSAHGMREMFTNELWLHPDSPQDTFRPPQEDMELFTKRIDDIVKERGDDNLSGVDLRALWPSREETNEYLVETGRDGMRDGEVRYSKSRPPYSGFSSGSDEEFSFDISQPHTSAFSSGSGSTDSSNHNEL